MQPLSFFLIKRGEKVQFFNFAIAPLSDCNSVKRKSKKLQP